MKKTRLAKFSPKTSPLKPRGMKNEIMKFLGFSKIGDRFLSQIIFKEKFFFSLKKYISRISSPDFGKPQKFHDFIFHSPGFEQKSFPAWKRFLHPEKRFLHLNLQFHLFLFKKHFFSSNKFHQFFGNIYDNQWI